MRPTPDPRFGRPGFFNYAPSRGSNTPPECFDDDLPMMSSPERLGSSSRVCPTQTPVWSARASLHTSFRGSNIPPECFDVDGPAVDETPAGRCPHNFWNPFPLREEFFFFLGLRAPTFRVQSGDKVVSSLPLFQFTDVFSTELGGMLDQGR